MNECVRREEKEGGREEEGRGGFYRKRLEGRGAQMEGKVKVM